MVVPVMRLCMVDLLTYKVGWFGRATWFQLAETSKYTSGGRHPRAIWAPAKPADVEPDHASGRGHGCHPPGQQKQGNRNQVVDQRGNSKAPSQRHLRKVGGFHSDGTGHCVPWTVIHLWE